MLSENNELLEGELTNQEFALWRGVSKQTLENKKAKYLEELNAFAFFHIEGKRKVIIDSVVSATYEKKNIRLLEEFKAEIPKHTNKNGYDNGKSISNKLKSRFPQMKDNSRYGYTLLGVKQVYPDRLKVWVLKVSDTEVRPMDAEEREIFHIIYTKYFGSAVDKTALVKDMVAAGELEIAKAWAYYEEISDLSNSRFIDFLFAVKAVIGFLPVRGFYIPELDKYIEA